MRSFVKTAPVPPILIFARDSPRDCAADAKVAGALGIFMQVGAGRFA